MAEYLTKFNDLYYQSFILNLYSYSNLSCREIAKIMHVTEVKIANFLRENELFSTGILLSIDVIYWKAKANGIIIIGIVINKVNGRKNAKTKQEITIKAKNAP